MPRCTEDEFKIVVEHTLAYQEDSSKIEELWLKCHSKIFSHEKHELRLGLGDEGINSYYNDRITKEDIQLVQKYDYYLNYH